MSFDIKILSHIRNKKDKTKERERKGSDVITSLSCLINVIPKRINVIMIIPHTPTLILILILIFILPLPLSLSLEIIFCVGVFGRGMCVKYVMSVCIVITLTNTIKLIRDRIVLFITVT